MNEALRLKVGDKFRDLLGHVWVVTAVVIDGWQYLAVPEAFTAKPARFGRSDMREY